jgi:pre-mRNA-splicing helicase BRR2
MAIHIQSFSIPHFLSLMVAMSKPADLTIREHSPTKPVNHFCVFKETVSVDDLLSHCSADDKPDLFLNIELTDLQPHLDNISDKGVAETLKHGIGYYHEALDIL